MKEKKSKKAKWLSEGALQTVEEQRDVKSKGVRERYIQLNTEFQKIARRDKVKEVTQSCPTLCSPIDCSLPGSSVYGIFQARILEWVAISFRRSSGPRD